MKKHVNYLISIIILINSLLSSFAQIKPEITAGIDTSKHETKQVYDVFVNYINSKPDSLYDNPFWNKNEIEFYKNAHMPNFNRSTFFMFRGYTTADSFYKVFEPKILSITKVETNRYAIKTIYEYKNENYSKFSPSYITKFYAVKGVDNKFYLENTLNYDTRNWKTVKSKFIHFVIHPDCTIDKKDVVKAIRFCENFCKKFGVKKISPFTYYITGNSDEMGKLFNFEYWLSYSTGITNTKTKEIYTSFGIAYFPHEFVHILAESLFTVNKRTFIMNEGFATWLGGPSIEKTYKDALLTFSKEIYNNDTISVNMIKNGVYRHPFDNNPVYVTGAVICELVYKNKGKEGLMKILNSTDESFEYNLEFLFEMKYIDIDRFIIKHIKDFSVK